MATVDPWASSGGDNTEYFHTNHLGTTRFMSEPDGDPVDAAVYTPFGERVDGTNHRYGYDGAWGYQAHDFPSGDPIPYLHVGARYYDPASGRFLQRDPIGIDGGLNVYEYVKGGPGRAVDPFGLRTWTEVEEWDRVLPMFLVVCGLEMPCLKSGPNGEILGQFAYLEHWERRTTYYYDETAQAVLQYSAYGAGGVAGPLALAMVCFPEPVTTIAGAAMLAGMWTAMTYGAGAETAALLHKPQVIGVSEKKVGVEIIVIPYEGR
jgi:RHS repeat-associated protein